MRQPSLETSTIMMASWRQFIARSSPWFTCACSRDGSGGLPCSLALAHLIPRQCQLASACTRARQTAVCPASVTPDQPASRRTRRTSFVQQSLRYSRL